MWSRGWRSTSNCPAKYPDPFTATTDYCGHEEDASYYLKVTRDDCYIVNCTDGKAAVEHCAKNCAIGFDGSRNIARCLTGG